MNKLIASILLIFYCANPLRAEEVTIAALGDSLTQGFGLIEAEGFVPQLQHWLDRQGAQARLINAGVSGDTSAGGLSRIAWTLTPDVDAVIVALGGNDLLRGIEPGVTRQNIDGILSAAAQAKVPVLLVGMQAPGNYGAAYKAAFDGLYPDLADRYGALFMESFFEGLPSADPAALQGYLQADGIHPNARGVARIVEGFGPHVLGLIDKANAAGS